MRTVVEKCLFYFKEDTQKRLKNYLKEKDQNNPLMAEEKPEVLEKKQPEIPVEPPKETPKEVTKQTPAPAPAPAARVEMPAPKQDENDLKMSALTDEPNVRIDKLLQSIHTRRI